MTRNDNSEPGNRRQSAWGDEPAELPQGDRAVVRRMLILLGVGLVAFVAGIGYLVINSGGDRQVASLIAERVKLDETVWKDEVLAQEYETVFVDLWDSMRGAPDPYIPLAELPFETITLAEEKSKEVKDWGIELGLTDGESHTLTHNEWGAFVQTIKEQYQLVESEWHHARFTPPSDSPATSTISMTLHLKQEASSESLIVRGKLEVEWKPRAGDEKPVIASLDARDMQLLRRQGKPAFETAMTSPSGEGYSAIIARDMNGDGLSELLVPGANVLLANQGNFRFQRLPLFEHASETIKVATMGDFTGDGRDDMLAANLESLLLYPADANGQFTLPPKTIDVVDDIDEPMVITAGDVDHDGDLDAWVGQYKTQYNSGQMPDPYFDANDGNRSYLLLNDGKGNFRDGTEAAGLAEKRRRRVYSAALFDMDVDGDLDLLVACDFAGLDVHENQGDGTFRDATADLVDEHHCFGMSLTFGDYDQDGKVDFFMTGMGSTTARRLDQLGLTRDEFPEHAKMRSLMGYGNRMYLARANQFLQPEFKDQVARTGWSWGASTFDFDNDGDNDIYVANGHISGTTARDYCSRYWCHDIYTGTSDDNPTVSKLFDFVHEQEMQSWNGFEHNALLMNENGQGFVNIGFLMNVSSEIDSRAVVSDDLDGDGRMDLLVVERASQQAFQVRVLRNQWSGDGGWIGARLTGAVGCSTLGARVIAKSGEQVFVKPIVAGDSLTAQHAPMIHFGLGNLKTVDSLEVIWPNGKRQRLESPEIGQYYEFAASQLTP